MILLVGIVFLVSQVQVLMCISGFLQYNQEETSAYPQNSEITKALSSSVSVLCRTFQSRVLHMVNTGPVRGLRTQFMQTFGVCLSPLLMILCHLNPTTPTAPDSDLCLLHSPRPVFSVGLYSPCSILKNVPHETCRFSVGPTSDTSLLKFTA